MKRMILMVGVIVIFAWGGDVYSSAELERANLIGVDDSTCISAGTLLIIDYFITPTIITLLLIIITYRIGMILRNVEHLVKMVNLWDKERRSADDGDVTRKTRKIKSGILKGIVVEEGEG